MAEVPFPPLAGINQPSDGQMRNGERTALPRESNIVLGRMGSILPPSPPPPKSGYTLIHRSFHRCTKCPKAKRSPLHRQATDLLKKKGDRWDFPFRWIDTQCTRAPSQEESLLPTRIEI